MINIEDTSFKYPVVVKVCNGPPGSGKDTVAEFVEKTYGYKHLRMKNILYKHTADYYHVPVWLVKLCGKYHWLKNRPIPWVFDGLSCRQALIHVSENVYKTQLGRDYFGKAALREVAKWYSRGYTKFIFSDCGFIEELEVLYKGVNKVQVYKLVKKGTSFKGDSRNYISLSGVREFTLCNNLSKDHLYTQIRILEAYATTTTIYN